MRHAPTVPISHLRLTRLLLWAGLWLARLLEWLACDGGPFNDFIEARLRKLARVIASVIVLRVLKQWRPRRRPRPWIAVRGDGWRRAAIGSALRRALRARGISDRIDALFAAIANADALVAKLTRRLRAGLSRRAPVFACAGDTQSPASAFAPPLCADTS